GPQPRSAGTWARRPHPVPQGQVLAGRAGAGTGAAGPVVRLREAAGKPPRGSLPTLQLPSWSSCRLLLRAVVRSADGRGQRRFLGAAIVKEERRAKSARAAPATPVVTGAARAVLLRRCGVPVSRPGRWQDERGTGAVGPDGQVHPGA